MKSKPTKTPKHIVPEFKKLEIFSDGTSEGTMFKVGDSYLGGVIEFETEALKPNNFLIANIRVYVKLGNQK